MGGIPISYDPPAGPASQTFHVLTSAVSAVFILRDSHSLSLGLCTLAFFRAIALSHDCPGRRFCVHSIPSCSWSPSRRLQRASELWMGRRPGTALVRRIRRCHGGADALFFCCWRQRSSWPTDWSACSIPRSLRCARRGVRPMVRSGAALHPPADGGRTGSSGRSSPDPPGPGARPGASWPSSPS